jgi:alkaline phosphatase
MSGSRPFVRIIIHATLFVAALATPACASGGFLVTGNSPDTPKNMILFIGDGMGPAQVAATAAHLFGDQRDAQGDPLKLSFEQFPAFGYLTTFSSNSYVTDSAAAGTALACGVKTNNGVIGQTPDGTSVASTAEKAADRGLAVGVVSSVGLNHATPAVFYAHVPSRNQYNDIVDQFFASGHVDVLMGGGIYGDRWTTEAISTAAGNAGYSVFTCDNFDQLDPATFSGTKVFGYFDTNNNHQLDYEAERTGDSPEPHLSDLALKTVELLSRDPDGFFLMVEGGAIDWGGHANNPANVIGETMEFDRTISRVIDLLRDKGMLEDTLIVVTADHETGGLGLTGPYQNRLSPEHPQEFGWTSTNHTAIPVPVYARGPGAQAFIAKNDNTFVARRMQQLLAR